MIVRFFAGGDQSVRGYEYQTLSPENDRGDRIGGRYMVALSLHLVLAQQRQRLQLACLQRPVAVAHAECGGPDVPPWRCARGQHDLCV